VGDDSAAPSDRRRVKRGEGEVTQWPRGVAGYVASGPEDATPSPDEDRVANRLALVARLLSVARSQGRPVDGPLARLRSAREALERGDRAGASRAVEELIAELGGGAGPDAPGAPPRT
jgi:hypothetical protein